ncbi:BDN_1c_G0006060.mRNA.1.CDS.1 [Saccharomyces cerevisiae]|nr:BDN_1c_G0006060.mRNA.1.CDS.1 [Saccharomyces cerevisiae]CAI7057817.1 BDN_1c_G0006060.mRNA.1.CDS.1 [Saccharomyces cerevisiae]
MFAAPELLGCDNDTILRILRNKSIGCDLVPKLDIGYNLNVFEHSSIERGGFQRNSLLPSSSKFVK